MPRNLIWGMVDRMGFTNGFAFDALRRRTDTYDALGHNTHYSYCTCGALESVTDATGTNLTTFTYDAAGRRLGVTGPDGYWVTKRCRSMVLTDFGRQRVGPEYSHKAAWEILQGRSDLTGPLAET